MRTKMRGTMVAVAAAATIAVGETVAFASPSSVPAATRVPATAGFTWHPLHVINGWRIGSQGATGIPAYAVQSGVLYLRGVVIANRPQPVADTFAVLPAGVRPSHYLVISCANSTAAWTGTAAGTLLIEPNGDMLITMLTNNAAPSLSGVSFPLSS